MIRQRATGSIGPTVGLLTAALPTKEMGAFLMLNLLFAGVA